MKPELMKVIGNVVLRVKKKRDGEWWVTWQENGRYCEGPSCPCSDKQDAIGTMADMAKREQDRQARFAEIVEDL